jgi:hypothetical protein
MTRICGHDSCTFRSCRERQRAYDRNRHRQIGYGTWQALVDAEPVRAHVRGLMDKGATLRLVAAAADYDHGSLGRIMWGYQGQPVKGVKAATAARILAVTLPQAGISPMADTDATGTRRRLRALHATGRPIARIARDLSYTETWVRDMTYTAQVVPARTALHVAARYDDLKDRAPEVDGVRPQDVRASRVHAAALGWHAPAMWDTDIDDPAADPLAPDPEVAIPSVTEPTRAELLPTVRVMWLAGATDEQIAGRIGRAERTVTRWRKANGWVNA